MPSFDEEVTDLMDATGLDRDQATALWYAVVREEGVGAFLRGCEEVRRVKTKTQAEEIAHWQGFEHGRDETNFGPEGLCHYQDRGLWESWHDGFKKGLKKRR